MAEAILQLEQVTKRFDRTLAADRLSLTVHRGEFFTFLGPSGSGKSTILRMIAGLERPDAGRILIAGQDVERVPPWRRNLGMVFQHYAIFPHMTVAENVSYGLRVRRRPPAEIGGKVARLLALVGLAGMAGKNVTLLSGGEQQRVALARALVLEPSLLLLDEPLSALDEKIRREMQAELKHIQQKTGTTFLYVTHDQEEALTMSDRIAVLHDGACVQCDAPERLFRRPRTRFVAGFFRGCNILAADLAACEPGRARVTIGGAPVMVSLDGVTLPEGSRLAVALRAGHVRVGRAAAACQARLAAPRRPWRISGSSTSTKARRRPAPCRYAASRYIGSKVAITARMIRNANGSAQTTCTVVMVRSEGVTPSWRKKNALASPMLTPGMKSGSRTVATIRRGRRSSRTAIAASSASGGVMRPTRAPTRSEFWTPPTSSGLSHSWRYQRSVTAPARVPASPPPPSENSSGGASGT